MYDTSKVERYLKPGEMEKLLGPIEREVYRAINARTKDAAEVHVKTGISKMATVLACYRLVGLGLIVEKPGRLEGRKRRAHTHQQ